MSTFAYMEGEELKNSQDQDSNYVVVVCVWPLTRKMGKPEYCSERNYMILKQLFIVA